MDALFALTLSESEAEEATGHTSVFERMLAVKMIFRRDMTYKIIGNIWGVAISTVSLWVDDEGQTEAFDDDVPQALLDFLDELELNTASVDETEGKEAFEVQEDKESNNEVMLMIRCFGTRHATASLKGLLSNNSVNLNILLIPYKLIVKAEK